MQGVNDSVRNAILVAILGLMLSVSAFFYLKQSQENFAAERFQALSEHVVDSIFRKVSLYEYGIRSSRAVVLAAGSESFSLADFRAYMATRDVDAEFPGARGFGFIRKLAIDDEQDFLQRIRAERPDGFQIRSLGDDYSERFVIEVIEPEYRNEQAVGLDIGSESNRRNAALLAARLNRGVLTHPITLVQATGATRQGFLFLIPVYSSAYPAQDPDARLQQTVGWAYSPIVIEEVLQNLDLIERQYSLSIYDDDGKEGDKLFYDSGSSANEKFASYTVSNTINMFERSWKVQVVPLPGFFTALNRFSPIYILLGSLALTLVASLLAYQFFLSRYKRWGQLNDKANLSALVQASSDAIFTCDTAGMVLASNEAAQRLLKFGDRLERNSNVLDLLFRGGDHRRAVDHYREAVCKKAPVNDFAFCTNLENEQVYCSISFCPVSNQDGRVDSVTLVLRDLSERNQYQNSLFELDRRLTLLIDNMPVSLVILDRDLNLIAVSKRWQEQNNLEGKDVIGVNIYGLSLSFSEHLKEAFELGLEGKITRCEGEPNLYGPDEGVQYLSWELIPWRDAEGNVGGMLLITEDVTGEMLDKHSKERLQRELSGLVERRTAELMAARQNVYVLYDAIRSQMAFSVTSAQGIIKEVNPEFCNLSGYAEEDLVGQPQRFLNSGFHPRVFWKDMWMTLGDGRPWRGEICNRSKSGDLFWVDAMIAPVVDEEGGIKSFISIFADLTEKKNEAQQLAEEKAEADRANEAKTTFLANMSHEIRTPLNAIIGLAFLMQKTDLDEYQLANMSKIDSASNTLLGIVNDVLDLSKIEAGELTLESYSFRLSSVVRDVQLMFSDMCKQKGLTLEISDPTSFPVDRLAGDAVRVRQILINLLSNAIKFTERGKVCLRFDFEEVTDHSVQLGIEVEDTGVGMDRDTMGRLFRPFSQADVSTTREYGGTGLGLSIVRTLAELMNGHARATSELGQGSMFRVQIRLSRDLVLSEAPPELNPVQAEQFSTKRDLKGIRVLLVDDSHLNVEIAQAVLEMEGAQVVAAYNGQEAIDWLKANPNQIDLVLMDVQMPVLDGRQATEVIRNQLGLIHLPIVGLSAGALLSERTKALESGMNDYLTKPIEPEKMREIILKMMKVQVAPH